MIRECDSGIFMLLIKISVSASKPSQSNSKLFFVDSPFALMFYDARTREKDVVQEAEVPICSLRQP